MARHALGRPTAPARALAPAPSARRRGVAALLLGATVAAGAAALVPGVAEAAPVPTAPAATPARADLAVTVDAPSTLPANQFSLITVTVTNTGPAAADRVRTLVTLPPGMVSIGSLPQARPSPFATTYRFDETESLGTGESRTYRLAVFAYRARPLKGTITATTRSTTLDPALRNNTGRAPVTAPAYDGGPVSGPIVGLPL